MEDPNHDHQADTVEDDMSFWDYPPERLNWFGRLLHRIRNFFFKKA